MTRTVVALYDDFMHANDAVRDLVNNGFSRQDISLMASDASGEYGRYLDTDERIEEESGAAEGAGVGAGIGAVIGGLGGLLVGLGALAIPGIGPVVAAGPLAAALSGLAGAGIGAVAGGITGGLLGALVDMGIPEENAQYYAEGVRRGGTLVTVRTPDDMTDRAVNILNQHGPVDINRRVSDWRDEGWTGFDPNAGPYRDTDFDYEYERTETGYAGAGTGTGYSEDISSQYQDYATYEPTFREHFSTIEGPSGYTYDQYEPAYRYGYDLATNDRYRDYSDWNEVEPEAQRYWDERNPGTWERFKNAVRHAWEEVKDAVD